MTELQLLWFCLIGLIFGIYFFLDGFDYGVGMSLRFLAKNPAERSVLVDSIDPVWEANQVWLVIAGGVLFATFPLWYATMFSAFYLYMLFVLFALIIRGAAIGVMYLVESARAKGFWQFVFFLGSLLVPILFGALFISLVVGIPIAQDGSTAVTFLDYISYTTLIGGATLALLCLIHGLSYISLKVKGDLADRATRLTKQLYPALFVFLVAFAWLIFSETDFFQARPISSAVLLVILLVFAILSVKFTADGRKKAAFLFNGLSLAGVVAFIFNGLFPRVMVSSTSHANDILIQNASSAANTLELVTIVACVLLPILILYQIWVYYLVNRRHRVKTDSAVKEE